MNPSFVGSKMFRDATSEQSSIHEDDEGEEERERVTGIIMTVTGL